MRGFTIIEILTVVAIIGILATLLFPLVGKAQQNARKAKTRVQFSQWGSAIEAFRQEYGFYPNFFSGSSAISDDKMDSNQDAQIFVETLSGRKIEGTMIGTSDRGYAAGNTKKIAFYTFGADDLTPETAPRIQDAFGNAEVVVLLDRDYNGLITVGTDADYATAPPVNGYTPNLGTGIRAGVIFYSPGAGNSSEDIVTSWK